MAQNTTYSSPSDGSQSWYYHWCSSTDSCVSFCYVYILYWYRHRWKWIKIIELILLWRKCFKDSVGKRITHRFKSAPWFIVFDVFFIIHLSIIHLFLLTIYLFHYLSVYVSDGFSVLSLPRAKSSSPSLKSACRPKNQPFTSTSPSLHPFLHRQPLRQAGRQAGSLASTSREQILYPSSLPALSRFLR